MVAPEHNEIPQEDGDVGTPVAGPAADPADVAFDSVFDSVSTLYRVTGRVFHQLVGLEFRSGRAHDAHIEIVRVPERVGVLIRRMQRRWGAVAHVRLAEQRTDNVPGLDHPERRTLAVIEIHVKGRVATACCRVNPQTRELFRPSKVTVVEAAASAPPAGA